MVGVWAKVFGYNQLFKYIRDKHANKGVGMSVILLRRRNVDAVIPCGKFEGDAGMDLTYIGPSRIIWPWQVMDLETGWDINISKPNWGQIKSRSSTFYKRKILVLEGVIDSGYTGPLSVAVMNPGPFPKKIKNGDRLGQLVIHQHREVWLEITQHHLPKTDRGTNGFGSTGGL